MPYRPGDPTRTRQLLAALAAPPDHPTTTTGTDTAWADELEGLTRAITDTVTADVGAHDKADGLGYEQLHHWRNELDRLLAALERDDPLQWARARTPGSWLDSLLRLRSVLTHVVAKAYWSGNQTIRYGEIEIERYLWGAR